MQLFFNNRLFAYMIPLFSFAAVTATTVTEYFMATNNNNCNKNG